MCALPLGEDSLKLRLGLVAALVITSAAAFTSPASASDGSDDGSSTLPMSPDAEENCMIVLAPMQKGESESRIVEHRCSSDPAELAPDTGHVLIMTWYAAANFGDPHTDIYVWWGTCNRQGYGISDVGAAWAARISSFAVWGACQYTDAWDQTSYTGDHTVYSGNVAYVGDSWNDRIRSMWVTS